MFFLVVLQSYQLMIFCIRAFKLASIKLTMTAIFKTTKLFGEQSICFIANTLILATRTIWRVVYSSSPKVVGYFLQEK